MKVMNAKELRQKLDETLDRVLSGEDVVIKHRFKKPVRLSPVEPPKADRAKLAGLEIFDNAKKQPSPYSPKASVKELYSRSIAKKYAK